MKPKAALILLLLAATTLATYFAHPALALTFSSSTSLPNPDPYDNVFPRLMQLQNGSVWMIWEKILPSTGGEIYLMADNGYGWGAENRIVNGAYDDISPSAAQLDNGTIILVWSRGIIGNLNSYQVYSEKYTSGQWSSPAPLVTSSSPNFDPALAKTGDGSVWMVWSRSLSTNGNGDLYYRILRNGAWSAEAIVPTASTPSFEEKLPTITQTIDGRIWVTFETNAAGTPQLNATTTFTGSSWTPSRSLTSSSNIDKWPSMTQDRNGTLWIFWARELPNGTSSPPNPQPLYQWDIYYKLSINNGTSWGPDTDLANSISTDEQHPVIFQGPDERLWVVYDSCCNSQGNPYGNPNLLQRQSQPLATIMGAGPLDGIAATWLTTTGTGSNGDVSGYPSRFAEPTTYG